MRCSAGPEGQLRLINGDEGPGFAYGRAQAVVHGGWTDVCSNYPDYSDAGDEAKAASFFCQALPGGYDAGLRLFAEVSQFSFNSFAGVPALAAGVSALLPSVPLRVARPDAAGPAFINCDVLYDTAVTAYICANADPGASPPSQVPTLSPSSTPRPADVLLRAQR